MPTALTRRFRSGQAIGDNGRQQAVRSNFSSGVGMNRQYQSTAPLSGPTSADAQPDAAAIPAAATRTPLSRAPLTSNSTRNSGGTITAGGKTTSYAPTAYNSSPDRPNRGGTMTRQLAPGIKATTVVPPSPAAIRSQMTPALATTMPSAMQPALDSPGTPVPSPATSPQPAQNDPLTGATPDQPITGQVQDVNPGKALGFSNRGNGAPQGDDAQDGHDGGSGLYAKKFKSKTSADLYSAYTRKLFGGDMV